MWGIPVVGPALAIATGIGASMAIYKQLAGAKSTKVEDASISAEGPVVTSKAGDIYEGIAGDDVLMGPGLAGAAAATQTAASGGGSGAVVNAINNLNESTKANKISEKQVGKRTGQALEQLGDG